MTTSTQYAAQVVRNQIERLKLLYPEMSEDAELLADMLEGATEFREVMTRLVKSERDTKAIMAAIKAQEDELTMRRARYEMRGIAARKMMHSLMEVADVRRLELPTATVSIAAGRKSCIVTNEAQLPERFVKVERMPKKADITKALLAGEDVPGAALSNGPETLMVRV